MSPCDARRIFPPDALFVHRDWLRKVPLDISGRFGTVVLEDLSIRKMTTFARGRMVESNRSERKKAELNPRILNQGWFASQTILADKLAE